MKDYIRKYRNNELSPSEFSQLRQRLQGMTDDELSDYMGNDWATSAIDASLADDDKMAHIQSRLAMEISSPRGNSHVVTKLLKYAAIVLIPLLTIATIYLYSESHAQLPDDMVVTTGKGESACVNLPDGTKVTLYYESKLSYGAHSFTKDKREVRFEGDGFFEVHADSANPFVVNSEGLSVTVLGTIFSLSARHDNDTAELYLEKGRVSLCSSLTDESVVMNPNERACINYKTGKITVERLSENPCTLRKGYLSFNSVPLSKVVKTLNSNFGCEIVVGNKSLLDKTFSGTLPAKNIDDALEVLRLSFNSSVSRDGNRYVIE